MCSEDYSFKPGGLTFIYRGEKYNSDDLKYLFKHGLKALRERNDPYLEMSRTELIRSLKDADEIIQNQEKELDEANNLIRELNDMIPHQGDDV